MTTGLWSARRLLLTMLALVVAANAVMVAAFALVPAMRLVDAPAPR